LVVAIIWLWGTLFVAGFYPIIDGGYDQVKAVYRALKAHRKASNNGQVQSSTPSSTASTNGVVMIPTKVEKL
jgi:hypothetical protein